MVLLTGPTEKTGRPVTYVRRSHFLVAAAALLVGFHPIDLWAAGGSNWPALALRVVTAAVLLLEAWALRSASPPLLRRVTVLVALLTPLCFTGLMLVTGRTESVLLPLGYVLALVVVMVLFDLLPVGLISSVLFIGGTWLMLFLDDVPLRRLVAWLHVGVVDFILGWVLGVALRATQRANDGLIEELRDALGSVKTLKGLLPVCAWCHKIRNDAGYWERLEAYISSHSEAEFSHGMCPECFAKHYGEIDSPPPSMAPSVEPAPGASPEPGGTDGGH